MGITAEKVVVELIAQVARHDALIAQSRRDFDRHMASMATSANRMEKSVSRSADVMSRNLRVAISGIAVGALARQTQQYADSWTSARNSLISAGIAGDRVDTTLDRLADTAIRTRSEFDATVTLYGRLTAASENLGVSEEAVARAVEITNKALASGRLSAAERASAITQLSQGLGSQVLQGDELKAIRENSITLARAIAAEFNTTIGGLKKLGEEGKLTSDRVFAAIIRSGAQIDATFAKTQATVGDSFTNLETAAIRFIGAADQATGASRNLGQFINFAADNIGTFVDVAVVAATVVGGVLAGRFVAFIATQIRLAQVSLAVNTALIAQAALTSRVGLASGAAIVPITGLGAAMARLTVLARGAGAAMLAMVGGPIGAGILAIGGALLGLVHAQRENYDASKQAEKATGDLEDAIRNYENAVIAAQVATGQDKVAAEASAKAKRALAVEARNAAQALLEQARATIRLAQADNARVQASLARNFSKGGAEIAGGQVFGNNVRIRQAEADAKAAEEAINRANESLARLDAQLDAPLTGAPGGSTDGKGKGKGGRGRGTTLEDIRLQALLDEAQARGDERTAQALADQIELRRKIDEYQQAGLSKARAQALAEQDMAALQAAREEAYARERQIIADNAELEAARAAGDLDTERKIERRLDLQARTLEYQRLGLDLAEATRKAEEDRAKIEEGREEGRAIALLRSADELEIQIATLKGEIEFARLLERKVELEDRIKKYREDGLDLVSATTLATKEQLRLDEARAEANARALRDAQAEHELRLAELANNEREVERLKREAEIRRRTQTYRERGMSPQDAEAKATRELDEEAAAKLQGQFKTAFTEGVMAALDGDFKEWFSNWVEEGARKGLEKALNNIADLLWRIFQEAMSQAGSSTGGGDWISTAVNAFASIFGGKREGGGPVTAGKAYVVGEKRPEVFVPGMSGTIVPNLNAFNTRDARRSGGGLSSIAVALSLDLRGVNGEETMARIAAYAARKSFEEAVKAANAAAPGRVIRFQQLEN